MAEGRHRRVINRLFRLTTLNSIIILLGLLALADFFIELIPVVAWLPLLVSLALLWMARESPLGTEVRQPRMAELVSQTALMVVAVVFSLALLEIVFRFGVLENEVPVSDDEFEQLIAAAWPRPIAQQRDPHKLRILGLSDSFGEAGGPKNYHYVLETLFVDAGIPVEVVNFSRGSYEPFDQLALFRRFAKRYQPDLVLHGFYVGNDFATPTTDLQGYQGIVLRSAVGVQGLRPRNFLLRRWFKNYLIVVRDNFQKSSETAAKPPARAIDKPVAERTIGNEIMANSPGRNAKRPATKIKINRPGKDKQTASADTTTPATTGTFSQTEFLRIERNRLKLFEPRQPPAKMWAKTVAVLDEIRAESARMGSAYVMVIHPDQLQVEDEVTAAVKERYDLDLSRYDLALPQNFLINDCAQDEIKCLDLLPIFKARSDSLYLLRDTHYNNKGNRLAATAIFEKLQGLPLFSEHKREK